MTGCSDHKEQPQRGSVECGAAAEPKPIGNELNADAVRDIISNFIKANGWKEITTTFPGTAQAKTQVKMLYESPLTGNYHSLSFALGMVLEDYGIAAT